MTETTTSIWEVDLTVSVTLEREGDENYMPSTRESMEMDGALKRALEGAEIDEVGDWTVSDWKVEG
jgi:hypothetical protein